MQLDANAPWLEMEDETSPPGWCDYMDFWRAAVDSAPYGSILVEVGVFCGRSLIQLARMAKEANKGLRVVGVDTFRGSEEHRELLATMPKGTLIRDCWFHLEAAGVLDDVTLMVTSSEKAAKLVFQPWAVFLDAAHDYESVKADLWNWGSLVHPKGHMGGHDYHTFPDVKKAVREYFVGMEVPENQSWWAMKGGAW